MIERGIVRIDDQRSEVIAVQAKPEATSVSMKQSITSEQFFESMGELDEKLPGALKDFIGRASALGVYPEFRKSLIIKWDTPSGKTVNLGYIMKNGVFWCQRRSKISPPGRSKTSPLDVMRYAVLGVVPVVHRRDPRCFV